MNTFVACLKKEFKETWRAKRLFTFALIAVAMMLFSFVILGVLQILKSLDVIPGRMASFIQLSYPMSTMFFMTFISSYFIIICIILLRDVFSKEINEKKWVLPMQAGIKPSTIMLARFLVITLTVVSSVLIACLLHFILTLIICGPATDMTRIMTFENLVEELSSSGVTMGGIPITEEILAGITSIEAFADLMPGINLVGFIAEGGVNTGIEYVFSEAASVGTQITNMLYAYGMAAISISFFTMIVCTLNAIIKKMGLTVFISIFIYLVPSIVFSSIEVGGKPLLYYTPFLFSNEMIPSSGGSMFAASAESVGVSIGWLEWLIASITTVAIIAGLTVWSISANKIKAEKN